MIPSSQYTLTILLRHLLIKVCTFFVHFVVSPLVSEPCNKTAFTSRLKILILLAVHRSWLLQTGLSIANTWLCTFFLLALLMVLYYLLRPFFVFCFHFSTISSITSSSMVSSLCSSRHRPRQGMFNTQLQQLHSMSTIHNRHLGKLAADTCSPYVGCMQTSLGYLLWPTDR